MSIACQEFWIIFHLTKYLAKNSRKSLWFSTFHSFYDLSNFGLHLWLNNLDEAMYLSDRNFWIIWSISVCCCFQAVEKIKRNIQNSEFGVRNSEFGIRHVGMSNNSDRKKEMASAIVSSDFFFFWLIRFVWAWGKTINRYVL